MKRASVQCVILRTLAIAVLTAVLLIFLVAILFVCQRIGYQSDYLATEGYLSLEEHSPCTEPVYLNGDWDSFDGVVCTTAAQVGALGQAPGQLRFPIASIVQAKKNATYRLRFSLSPEHHEKFFLYIPTFYKSASVYLNGVELSYLEDGTPWLPSSTIESVLPLVNLLPGSQQQELVITGAFDELPVTLYQRPPIIGTMKNLSSLAIFSSSNELFLFGLLLLILVNGYVFMLFRPGHKIISLMTLFDTMVLLRAALSMNYVLSFAKDIFPWMPVSDQLSSSLTLFFLLLGGVVGCKLATAIYDPQDKAPQWLIRPLPWLYAGYALVFPWLPGFFESCGRYVLVITYIITFIGVFLQYRVSWEIKDRRGYNLLQFGKTAFIGLLVFVDIWLWSSTTSTLLLYYLYSAFFLLHVVVRLYDNNESYRDVELLNTGLEETVQQRTRELSETNRVLSELSIKDPLTQSFNRLYFEQTMEQALADFHPEKPIHLCMLDLDFFKRINDTYGHDAGDEQLKAIVQLVSEVVQGRAVLARVGGEEFVLLFQGLEQGAVLECLVELCAVIAADAAANERHTTASFGVSAFSEGDSLKQLMQRADLALYEAKHLGRNRIVANLDGELRPVGGR